MDPVLIGAIVLFALLLLLALGVPVSTAIGGLGLVGMVLMIPQAFVTKTGISGFMTLESYNLAVLPLFSLMAMIIMHTGVGAALYDVFYKTVGRFSGGLAVSTILTCAVFAAICSTTTACALTVGLIALPEMRKAGYKDSLIAGSIASGGTLGPFIPPSSPMIVYGIATGTSITRLFVAGVVPGVMCMVLYSLTVLILCKKSPEYGPKGPKFSTKDIMLALAKCGEVIVLIIIVLGGMFAGFFTPTEAAGIGAAGAIIITLIRRKLNWKNFIESIKGAMKTCGMVYAMLIAAGFMNTLMTLSRLPVTVANAIASANVPIIVVLILIVVVNLILGFFMDGLGIMMLTIPIFFPIVHALGVDPIWFGVIQVVSVQIGNITPPVGMALFIVKGIDKSLSMKDIYMGGYTFCPAAFLAMAAILAFPIISTFLPSLLR